jgi:hypothetical protein
MAANPPPDVEEGSTLAAMQTAAAIIGWSGAVMLLGAYGLVATHRLTSRSVSYHVLNLAGALGLTIYAISISAWPNVALNAFWTVVGVIGIVMSVRAIRALRRS